MQKTYWWRTSLLILAIIGVAAGYLIFYPYQYGLCTTSGGYCIFSALKKTLAEPLFLLSVSLSVVSIFLFFVQDSVFKKWLRFAIAWLVLTAIFVALAPTYTGGWMSFGPTKESVSIWMGSLLVIISLVQLVWESRKLKVN